MGRRRSGKRSEIVSAFERGHDATLRMFLRDRRQALRTPCVISLEKHQLRQRIVAMGIEARRDNYQFRPEGFECRYDDRGKGLAEFLRATHRSERRIDNIADAALAR